MYWSDLQNEISYLKICRRRYLDSKGTLNVILCKIITQQKSLTAGIFCKYPICNILLKNDKSSTAGIIIKKNPRNMRTCNICTIDLQNIRGTF